MKLLQYLSTTVFSEFHSSAYLGDFDGKLYRISIQQSGEAVVAWQKTGPPMATLYAGASGGGGRVPQKCAFKPDGGIVYYSIPKGSFFFDGASFNPNLAFINEISVVALNQDGSFPWTQTPNNKIKIFSKTTHGHLFTLQMATP